MSYTDETIIDALYRLYEQPMYFLAYRILRDEYLAEDAVHDAFLRLIRNRRKITDPDSKAVRSYVSKTVKSAALDLYRKQKKHRDNCTALDESVENTVMTDAPTADMPSDGIADLPPKYAAVMRCLFLDGLNVRETSAVLNIREDLVRKRCERARKLLKTSSESMLKETHHAK